MEDGETPPYSHDIVIKTNVRSAPLRAGGTFAWASSTYPSSSTYKTSVGLRVAAFPESYIESKI